MTLLWSHKVLLDDIPGFWHETSMAHNDEQSSPSQYAAQLHKAQQNLTQFIPKYCRLVDLKEQQRLGNRQLRKDRKKPVC